MKFTKYRSLRESEIKEELLRRISDLLPNLKVTDITERERISKRTVPDLILEVKTGNTQKNLLIEIKSIGEPKVVMNAIFQLNKLREELLDTYPVFTAPFIGERSREICVEEGIGYIDLSGNAYLQFDSVLIDRISKNSSKIERENTRNIFSTKATRVLRTLLERPQDRKRIKDIAKTCDMSPSGVYYVLNQLENKGYVARTETKEIRVIEPKRLLLDWGNNWTGEKSPAERYFSFARSVEELMEKITLSATKLRCEYAFTGMAGASLVAPFVRFTDVWLYLLDDSKKLIEDLDLRPVSTGANVVILDPYDKGVFMGEREIRGKKVVSDIQLFLDLYRNPARGKEQAERILDTQIKFEDE
jgi:DNA-binding HxlR family transcriptional regulator